MSLCQYVIIVICTLWSVCCRLSLHVCQFYFGVGSHVIFVFLSMYLRLSSYFGQCCFGFWWSGHLCIVVNVCEVVFIIFGQCHLCCLRLVRKCEELSIVSKVCVSMQMSPVYHCYYPCGVTLYSDLALDLP